MAVLIVSFGIVPALVPSSAAELWRTISAAPSLTKQASRFLAETCRDSYLVCL